MMAKILFVVTGHTVLGNTGRQTGFHFSEMGQPYDYLINRGHTVDFVSPAGGPVRADGYKSENPLQKRLMEDLQLQQKLQNTLRSSDVSVDDYDAIYYVGGHGTMWDLPDDTALIQLTAAMYQQGKPVAAVCHGPAGLVNVKLSDGSYLVAGKQMAAFSDDEERAVGLADVVPFLLESTLVERGAQYTKAGLWQAHVVTDGQLISGQNPASALGVGQALDAALAKE